MPKDESVDRLGSEITRRDFGRLAAAASVGVALGACGGGGGEEPGADLVLLNGKVLTVDPEDRLIDAGYRVYRKHFERMKRNEPGTRIGEDPEFLHDMRVSTRRLRAAFRTFRPAFKKERMAGFNRDLKWIAAVLGVVRDLDVYLLNFPEYTADLGPSDPLQEHLHV